MSDVRITPQRLKASSVTPIYVAIAAGNTYQVKNTGKEMLHFLKSGAGVATITIITPKTVGGLGVADQTVSVPATTGDKMVGLFARSLYNNSNGDFEFTTNEGTGLTCAVIKTE